MQLGVVYPQIELGGDPEAVRVVGQAVEDLGYDHLVAYDHVLGAEHARRSPRLTGPYNERDPFHDPFVLFAYLAGRTERLGFVTGVLVLPQRQTALVARQAADLALLSGGRFRLGVGVGWNHVEFRALGQDFHTRGARIDEQIALLRRLWTESVVTFDGRFHVIDRAGCPPRPAEPIPIWIGGYSEPAFRRAARLADGFLFGSDPAAAVERWARVRQLLRKAGRPVEGFGADRGLGGYADPDVAARELERWAEVGGTHASVITLGLGFDSADAHVDYLARVAAAVDARMGAGRERP